MTFPHAIRQVLTKYADFSGRAMRPEFWWWALAVIAGSIVFGIADAALPYRFLLSVFVLLVLLPTWAVGARRLHDTGRSAWWTVPWAVSFLVFGPIFAVSAIDYAALDQDAGLEALAPFLGLLLSTPILLLMAIWSIIWLNQKGEDGPNRFGEAPIR